MRSFGLIFYNHGLDFTYVVDPAHVGADPGEDRGLLGVVAAHAGAEAHHTMDLPGAIVALAVQGTTGVSLKLNPETDVSVRLGFIFTGT